MDKELIIDAHTSEINIVFLEDKRLVEFHKEKKDNNYAVGDIYLGRVKKIASGLNAAFIDIGYKKDGFLHYFDTNQQNIKTLYKYTKHVISGNYNQKQPVNNKSTKEKEVKKISDILNLNQQILVQVSKEPISTKGPRISCDISFAGRYLVLIPFSNRVFISQKIRDDEERDRLRKLVNSIKPKNTGIIIRTVAEKKKVADLDADLKDLFGKWKSCIDKLQSAKAPQKIFGELSLASTVIRDMFNESFNNIYINDDLLFKDIKNYIKIIAPEKINIVKQYKEKTPILEHFNVEKQIKSSFGKIVTIKNGAYLIIEHTEALHTIDVNSGRQIKSNNDQEANAIEINLNSAIEIAHQVRLRDIGGIIIIDFIDMHESHNRRILYEKVKEEMKNDRAKHTILPVNRFGLIQITRQRVRPETSINTLEKCPVCGGTGKIEASITIIDKIEDNIKYLTEKQNEKYLKITVHPFIHAYLTKGFFSIQKKWSLKLKKHISICKMSSHHLLEYHFFNKDNTEIIIN